MSAKNVLEYYRPASKSSFASVPASSSLASAADSPRDFAKLGFASKSSLTAVNEVKIVVR